MIEKVVGWADQKERELAVATGVRTKTLTRFPTNGCTTEPELWWQVDLDLEPKGIQSTISVCARGDVVVQFANVRHPPFDTDAACDELRVALNEIDGVEISGAGLHGCPTCPDLGSRRGQVRHRLRGRPPGEIPTPRCSG